MSPAQEHRGEEKTRRTLTRFEERDRSLMEVAEDGLEHRLRQLLPGGFVLADHSDIEQHKRLPALIRTAT